MRECLNTTAQDVLLAYEIPSTSVSIEPLSGGDDNLNFKITTHCDVFVLRRYDLTDPHEVGFELDLMARLAGLGFPTPKVIPRKDGQLSGEWNGRRVALFEFLSGHHPTVDNDTAAVGVAQTLADLHQLTADMQGPHRSRTDKNRLAHFLRAMRGSVERDPNLQAFAQSVTDLLASRTLLVARCGPRLLKSVVHHDPHEGNVLVDSGCRVVALLDFDEAYIDFSITDVARLMQIWAFDEDDGISLRRARLLLTAYGRRRALSDEERWNLYDALMFACAADAAEYVSGALQACRGGEKLRESRSYAQFHRLRQNEDWRRAFI